MTESQEPEYRDDGDSGDQEPDNVVPMGEEQTEETHTEEQTEEQESPEA